MSPQKSTRDALKARGRAVAGSASTGSRNEPPAEPSTPEPAPAPPRTKVIKATVDLQPVEHRRLRAWCQDTADVLGIPEVAHSEVIRVLIRLVQEDPKLAARVRAELEQTGGSRRR